MGTITPVTTYSGVDLVASEGVAVGKQIGAAGLQSVAANSNYCGMQYSGPLAAFSWSPTAPGFDTNEDMVELYVPADVDRRDLWLVIFRNRIPPVIWACFLSSCIESVQALADGLETEQS